MSQDAVRHDQFLRYFSSDRHRLFRYIFSLVPIEADAEDIFQQASIVLWKKFGDFDQEREFYPWACRISFHCVLNYRRAVKRRRWVLSDELVRLIADERTQSSTRNRFRIEMLKECITGLSPKDSDLIRQVYENETPISVVAENTGRAVQTIHNRMNLIRKRLMDCVDRKVAASS